MSCFPMTFDKEHFNSDRLLSRAAAGPICFYVWWKNFRPGVIKREAAWMFPRLTLSTGPHRPASVTSPQRLFFIPHSIFWVKQWLVHPSAHRSKAHPPENLLSWASCDHGPFSRLLVFCRCCRCLWVKISQQRELLIKSRRFQRVF